MMRRLIPVLLSAAVFVAFLATLLFLYRKSEASPMRYEVARPERRQIVKKTVAPGAIVPRREVVVKPRVSGIIEELYVEAGQRVEKGALLAKIQIIPDAVNVNRAEAALRSARLQHQTLQKELARFRKLRDQGLLSEGDYVQQELAFKLRAEEVEAAESNLQLVRVGASKRTGTVSNLVQATISGTILEVPVKKGTSVIEANNFNEGTTIASIADMSDMIFQGRVDESEVGPLREGMPLVITVGALGERERFTGTLEYIAPKGADKQGTIEFEVRARVQLKPGVFVRANFSANADIILDERQQVLAVNEGWVAFERGKSYVQIEAAPGQLERREVELGLSDGIWSEVIGGIDDRTRLKIPSPN